MLLCLSVVLLLLPCLSASLERLFINITITSMYSQAAINYSIWYHTVQYIVLCTVGLLWSIPGYSSFSLEVDFTFNDFKVENV